MNEAGVAVVTEAERQEHNHLKRVRYRAASLGFAIEKQRGRVPPKYKLMDAARTENVLLLGVHDLEPIEGALMRYRMPE